MSDRAPRYEGPLPLAAALSKLVLSEPSDAAFKREGLRADSEYRDLGLAAATGGRIGAKHISAIAPFAQPTGWHWHDMNGHFVFVVRGWITFRFAGVGHNVVARSDDLELIEINLPADYATVDLPGAQSAAQPGM